MPTYGQSFVGIVGTSYHLIAEPSTVKWKTGGVTIDWTTVAAQLADVLLPGGTTIKAGQRYLPVGTVLGQITATGKFGPAENTGAGGRDTATLTRGKAFIVVEDWAENPPVGLVSTAASDHPGVIFGGTVWRQLLKLDLTAGTPGTNGKGVGIGGFATATTAQFLALFPEIDMVDLGIIP